MMSERNEALAALDVFVGQSNLTRTRVADPALVAHEARVLRQVVE
jgi:hypothetical protein